MTAKSVFQKIRIIDSHTGGEPTRVIVDGGPPLGNGRMSERLRILREDYDHFRRAIVNEPRGSDAIVGALLCKPSERSSTAGVIFFNNVGYIGMCGHGSIGLAVTLAHMGRITPGSYKFETPAGPVQIELHDFAEATVGNVPSYRLAAKAQVPVESIGTVTGDIAWGGNWFFLTDDCTIELKASNLEALTEYAWRIRRALNRYGLTGARGAEIEHIELYGPPTLPGAHSKNFVLCPGGSYDRSPCGTGTSAKMACLYADGMLREGEVWRQESLIGSMFEGYVTVRDGRIYPHIRGSAYITGEADLLINDHDPFRWGIRSSEFVVGR